MKLNIDFSRRGGHVVSNITDDRGEKMPCVRNVAVDHKHGGVCEVQITLLVDCKNVTLGGDSEGDSRSVSSTDG